MSSSQNIETIRRWMYQRIDPYTRSVSNQFHEGLGGFISFAKQNMYDGDRIWCPCKNCKVEKLFHVDVVCKHLFNKGFLPNYYVWTAHGEEYDDVYQFPTTNEGGEENTYQESGGEWNFFVYMEQARYVGEVQGQHESVHIGGSGESGDEHDEEHVDEDPNNEAAEFFNNLNAASQPLYDGCIEGLTRFSLASDVMTVKTKHNESEGAVDDWSHLIHKNLPQGNVAPQSYYETEKLMRKLSMSYQRIDVCQNNCMIYWGDRRENLMHCEFCEHPRYKHDKSSGKDAGRKKPIPYKRMFYLPIADRLKKLYLSSKTASLMRWHAKHTRTDGKMEHPSDGEAWKHFQQVYPDFAARSRNVYLGLCTDGFNPFGSYGGSYSLWPIILTPYNLPPDMCMKREYLYLTILVPGRDNPKRSFDVFLQPLIEELQHLWSFGVEAFDVSKKKNFNLRAVLMWTIGDFPAYAMLSGWSTSGKMSCPYCMHHTDAFQLNWGHKACWFDCHRRFLPPDHVLRNERRRFRKGNIVRKGPPPHPSGEDILVQLEDIYGLLKTVECGGSSHINDEIEGYGVKHNWYKHSIFWELPYWRTHLLRHNLDARPKIMKNQEDIALLCDRAELHLTPNGKAPVPSFRMSTKTRKAFLKWLKEDVKFPDGYVSNIGNCVTDDYSKMHGLKSHDGHIIMQRLLPFAFSELLPFGIHDAISEAGIFFRDLCARSLGRGEVDRLQNNIVTTLCNLEQIFPPSFFNVMEHLTIHLPMEAKLGGPVQFRWMYPFERFMFHLKKKGKSKTNVEGSIVEQFINEETTTYTSQYYGTPGDPVTSRTALRHAAGYVQQTTYSYDVSAIFRHVGSGSGRTYFHWLSDIDQHIAHTYILLNCEELRLYEGYVADALSCRLFDDYARAKYHVMDNNMLPAFREREFSSWLKQFVESDYTRTLHPLWLQELVRGPTRKCTCWNAYFCRGYNFHTLHRAENKRTSNYGVCVRGSSENELSYYGKLQDVIQLDYNGAVGLKVTLFKCDWFDTTWGTGTRMRKSGVFEVRAGGVYNKYDPFILTTQADQVSYVSYPRVKRKKEANNEYDGWLVAVN